MIRTEVETCREICSDLCKIKDLKENVQQDVLIFISVGFPNLNSHKFLLYNNL